MVKLSKRAQELMPSATLAMGAKARLMREEGIDVISFAQGEPDFDTPGHIREAAKNAIDAGFTRYPPSAGLPDLRRAIAAKLRRENNLHFDGDQIAITCGAKQAIYNALQVIIDEGDEVIIPAPYWVSYPEQVRLAGGRPVIIETRREDAFKLQPGAIRDAITPRTRAFILNSPSNPTGSAYTAGELKDLADALIGRGVTIISDEIYEKLVYGNFAFTSMAAAHAHAKEMTIVVNGVSKSYAMTGWRMGYAAGPREVISKMTELLGQQITGIPSFVQKACVEALENSENDVVRMRNEFESRRDLMLEFLLAIPGVKCHKPEGAFYLFPNIESYVGKRAGRRSIGGAAALAEYLLEEARIATVSGDAFGAPGHIRFSYATSKENIEEGMKRLAGALSKLR